MLKLEVQATLLHTIRLNLIDIWLFIISVENSKQNREVANIKIRANHSRTCSDY